MATFTITSCNLRWGLGVDDQPFDVAAAVGSFDTDLIALQEVWDPDDGTGGVRRIGESLGLLGARGGPVRQPRPPGARHHRRSRRGPTAPGASPCCPGCPVRSIRTLELGRLFERWDVAERTAILAEVDVEDRTVLVAAIHLSFVLPERRRAAAPAPRPAPDRDAERGGRRLQPLGPGGREPAHRLEPGRAGSDVAGRRGRTASSTTCSSRPSVATVDARSSTRSAPTTSRSRPSSPWRTDARRRR